MSRAHNWLSLLSFQVLRGHIPRNDCEQLYCTPTPRLAVCRKSTPLRSRVEKYNLYAVGRSSRGPVEPRISVELNSGMIQF